MRLQHRLALVLTALVVATGIAAVGPATTAEAAAPTTGRYTALDTTRAWSGTVGTTAKVVPIAGRAGVPANATAVVVNVEVEKPTAAGYVRVTPGGVDARVATQEFRAGQTISNLATVRLAKGGLQVKLSAGRGTVYLDVSGYYADGSGATYTPLDAARVFQGRVGTGAVRVPLAGKAGIPSTATAVAVNTEVESPTADGYVRVTPAGKDAQVAAQVFTRGTTISNLVTVKLAGGAAQVKVSRGTATVYMDVAGYYANSSTGSVFVPIDTVRAYAGPVTTTARTVRLTGTAGVPGTATAVVANAETEQTTAAGYLRVTPAGKDAQVATQVFGAKQAVSNLVIAKVVGSSVDRRVQVKVSRGSAVLDLDVAGYFVDGSSGSGFGADVSWPQCGTTLPTGHAFGVVGANGSLPNQSNPCVTQQVAWAAGAVGGTSQPKVQLYALAANPGRAASVWPTSNRDPGGNTVANPYGTCAGAYDRQCSYMYGYARAYEATHSRGVPTPSAYRWWIDVETSLSWQKAADSSDYRNQNRADLEGMVAALTAAKVSTVGIYSTKSQFNQIVGAVPSNSSLTGLPSWIAVGTDGAAAAQAACSAGGLTAGSRVMMTQYVVAGPKDQDVSCV
ncbi:hypothetical protein SAMN02800687_2612 [Curtobacterium sp. UNCCL20]|uniref:hypothetical protein n=1 Tax=Curtobacterium sp. UNCCL20 TaxID=1502773 RepID=UPI0008836B18|nr:hypothetical protein [Curtobacterium sp. UNCCL20]SDQ73563.1 hypothetical protein SAMN02800687_2612 [Curtobacterium sp. UNCCL20]